MTTGLATPALAKIMWTPSMRTQTKPSRSKTSASLLYQTGLNFGMNYAKGQTEALHAEELGAGYRRLAFGVAGFFQDLLECAHFFGFFQEKADRFLQICYSLVLGAAAGRNIQFQSVGHEGAPFFENPN